MAGTVVGEKHDRPRTRRGDSYQDQAVNKNPQANGQGVRSSPYSDTLLGEIKH